MCMYTYTIVVYSCYEQATASYSVINAILQYLGIVSAYTYIYIYIYIHIHYVCIDIYMYINYGAGSRRRDMHHADTCRTQWSTRDYFDCPEN